MKAKYISPVLIMSVAVLATGCKAKTAPVAESDEIVKAPAPMVLGGDVRKMPRAVVYKTNGDWNDKVAVKLNRADSTLIYYPGPYDVNSDTEPIQLADGWLLDRQGGIADNTAFLRWTMDQYHQLPEVPSPETIKANIIPGAKVTQIMVLPMTPMAAQSDTAAVTAWIRAQK